MQVQGSSFGKRSSPQRVRVWVHLLVRSFCSPTRILRSSSIPVLFDKHRYVCVRRIDAVIAVADRVLIVDGYNPWSSCGRLRTLKQIVLYDDPIVVARDADGVPELFCAVTYRIVLDDDVAPYTGIGIDANGFAAAVLHLVVTDDVVP